MTHSETVFGDKTSNLEKLDEKTIRLIVMCFQNSLNFAEFYDLTQEYTKLAKFSMSELEKIYMLLKEATD